MAPPACPHWHTRRGGRGQRRRNCRGSSLENCWGRAREREGRGGRDGGEMEREGEGEKRGTDRSEMEGESK